MLSLEYGRYEFYYNQEFVYESECNIELLYMNCDVWNHLYNYRWSFFSVFQSM